MFQGCSRLTWGHRQWRSPPQGPLGPGSRTGAALFGCCGKKWEEKRISTGCHKELTPLF